MGWDGIQHYHPLRGCKASSMPRSKTMGCLLYRVSPSSNLVLVVCDSPLSDLHCSRLLWWHHQYPDCGHQPQHPPTTSHRLCEPWIYRAYLIGFCCFLLSTMWLTLSREIKSNYRERVEGGSNLLCGVMCLEFSTDADVSIKSLKLALSVELVVWRSSSGYIRGAKNSQRLIIIEPAPWDGQFI